MKNIVNNIYSTHASSMSLCWEFMHSSVGLINISLHGLNFVKRRPIIWKRFQNTDLASQNIDLVSQNSDILHKSCVPNHIFQLVYLNVVHLNALNLFCSEVISTI